MQTAGLIQSRSSPVNSGGGTTSSGFVADNLSHVKSCLLASVRASGHGRFPSICTGCLLKRIHSRLYCSVATGGLSTNTFCTKKWSHRTCQPSRNYPLLEEVFRPSTSSRLLHSHLTSHPRSPKQSTTTNQPMLLMCPNRFGDEAHRAQQLQHPPPGIAWNGAQQRVEREARPLEVACTGEVRRGRGID